MVNMHNSSIDFLKCPLCYDNFKEIVFLPCKHLNVCFNCYQELLEKHIKKVNDQLIDIDFQCPFCK